MTFIEIYHLKRKLIKILKNTAGQNHQDAVKAPYKRHGLPDEQQALLPHITRFGAPHDIALYGDIKDKTLPFLMKDYMTILTSLSFRTITFHKI